MKNNKKNLWLSILAATLSLSFTSCKDNNGTNPSGTDPDTTDGIEVNVYEWKALAVNAKYKPTSNKTGLLAVDKGGKNLYVANDTGAELFNANLASFADITKEASWEQLDIKATGIAGGGPAIPGKALTLGAAAKIVRLAPTKSGVVLSTNSGAADGGGAALVLGKAFKAAWFAENGSATHLLDAGAASPVVYAGVLSKADGKEYVMVNNPVHATAGNSTVNADTSVAGVAAALGVNYKSHTAFTTAASPHFFTNAGAKPIIVDKQGVRIIADGVPGTDGNAQADTGVVALEGVPGKWNHVGKATPNTDISAVVGVGDLVYIAFKGAGDDVGGVAVFDAGATPKGHQPSADWTKTPVLNLAVKGTDVWAVTKTGLIKVGADAKRGDTLKAEPVIPAKDAATKGGFYSKTPMLPSDNIVDAKFVGDNLVISTSDNGLVCRLASVKHMIE